MNLVVVGINHRTAPVEERERLAFSAEQIAEALTKLISLSGITEAAILSTCNRVEVYAASENSEEAGEEIRRFLATQKGLSLGEIDRFLYTYSTVDAVRHLFRVTSSLDSMVVGEPQVLGQVKEAYRLTTGAGSTKQLLNKLFHRSFSAAKSIRTQTMLGANAVSVSFAAVELAKKIFGKLGEKTVMIVGAGNMADLAAQHLIGAGVKKVIFTNRTFERAKLLAERFKGEAVLFEELGSYLKVADIVITSTGSPQPIITRSIAEEAMRTRKHKPMFFIDIAVPKDVDPDVNNIENIYLYNIDDLQGVIDRNLKSRKQEALKAEEIITEEVDKFEAWRETLAIVPTIVSLREHFEAVAKTEIEKVLTGLPEPKGKERTALEALAHGIVGKLLHEPTTRLKHLAENGDNTIARACQMLFSLRVEVPPDEDEEADEENQST